MIYGKIFLVKNKELNLLNFSEKNLNININLNFNYLKAKNIQHYSIFTDKGSSIAERVIRTVRNLLKKPVFEKRNANWISELPSVIKQYNNTIHSSVNMTPTQASRQANEKKVYCNLKGNREVRKPKFNLGQLVRAGDIKKVFTKGDSTK